LFLFFNRPSCLMDGRRTTSNSNYPRDIPLQVCIDFLGGIW
jgi:hypothetical protein